jgi:hypothetical protein
MRGVMASTDREIPRTSASDIAKSPAASQLVESIVNGFMVCISLGNAVAISFPVVDRSLNTHKSHFDPNLIAVDSVHIYDGHIWRRIHSNRN